MPAWLPGPNSPPPSPDWPPAIRALLQQYGPGFGYLATVRADGGPRVHPVSPVITDEGLFCFIIDSPKRRDLERDGRYALHSFPPEESDDEAYVAGPRPSGDRSGPGGAAGASARAAPQVDWRLFEFTVDVAMLTRREQHSRASRASRRVGRPFGSGSTRTPRRRRPPRSPSRRRARPASAVTSSARPPDHAGRSSAPAPSCGAGQSPAAA